jgi:hypothetical protein
MSASSRSLARWFITHAGWLVPVSTVVTPWLAARTRARGEDELEAFFSDPPRWKRRRSGLFHADWLDLTSGRRWRASRLELREAYRLWAKHRDIRLGREDS